MHGGNNTDTDDVMDTGCTFLVTTTAVVKGMKAEIFFLDEELDIIDASGKSLDIIGTCKMFLENEILGGRKMVEAAVRAEDEIGDIPGILA